MFRSNFSPSFGDFLFGQMCSIGERRQFCSLHLQTWQKSTLFSVSLIFSKLFSPAAFYRINKFQLLLSIDWKLLLLKSDPTRKFKQNVNFCLCIYRVENNQALLQIENVHSQVPSTGWQNVTCLGLKLAKF